jgi:tripartite-type tricarboxylate transporter receptor subunit TctC
MKRLVSAFCLAFASFAAFALYPDKPVTLVVPFPPGGSTDAIARLLGAKLQERLGQNFVIENRAGATGTLGAAFVKTAPADGYTLFVSSLGPFVIAPHLIKEIKYDPLTDFQPIMIAVQAANVLVVPAGSNVKSLQDMLGTLQRERGRVKFASSGSGSSDHLSAELLWQQTGTQGLHVPYKGGAPAINDLLAGKVDAAFVNINSILQHVRAGKVRALAVSSYRRSPLLPDVPTLQEQGVKGAEVQSWQAVAAPKGLPPEVVRRLHTSLAAVFKDPAVREQLLGQGFEIVAGEPDHFRIVQVFEHTRYKYLIEARNIKVE